MQALAMLRPGMAARGVVGVYQGPVSRTQAPQTAGAQPASRGAMKSLEVGETLVVAQLNRLGRTQSEVVARLAELSDGGIYVETLDGLLNTAALGRMAPLVIGLLTGPVEVERSLIQERTRKSVEHRRRIGGNIGGRPCLADGRRELVKRLRNGKKS